MKGSTLLLSLVIIINVLCDKAKSLQSIRISVNYDELNAPVEYISYLKQKLVPSVMDYLQAILQVKPLTNNIVVSNTTCSGVPVNSTLSSSGVSADLLLLITTTDQSMFGVSYSICQNDSTTGRPTVASVIFSTPLIDPSPDIFKMNYLTLLREMMHILGFNNNYFGNYINPNSNTRLDLTSILKNTTDNQGYNRIKVISPKLSSLAQSYFKCENSSSTFGLYLDMNQYPTIFWDKSLLGNDFMTAQLDKNARVSSFTFAVLEDSGWYTVNFSMLEPLVWGVNQGCDILNGNSSLFTACGNVSNTLSSCTIDYSAIGYCDVDESNRYYVMPFEDEICSYPSPILISTTSINAYYGAHSACFQTSLGSETTQPLGHCLKYQCLESGSLNITINNNIYTCSQSGSMNVTDDKGSIASLFCPDPVTFCNTVDKSFCPLGCGGHGTCASGQCTCTSSYIGLDCIQPNTNCTSDCALCKDNTTCSICLPGFTIDKGQCVTCAVLNCQNCADASSVVCSNCLPGFILNSDKSSCSAVCPIYCSQCDIKGNCLVCDQHYYAANSKCRVCIPDLTNSASKISFKDNQDELSYQIYFGGDQVALICLDCGYDYNGTACLVPYCDPNCLTDSASCDAATFSCLKCRSGYYSYNGGCLSCPKGCTECSSVSRCTSCSASYYLQGFKCLPCSDSIGRCIDCSVNAVNSVACNLCEDGYRLVSSTSCQSNSPCGDGMYFESTDQKCYNCSEGCLYCLYDSSCLICKSGYYSFRDESGSVICKQCSENCDECSDSSVCITCNAGFNLNNNTCWQTCPSQCVDCTKQGICILCDSGYILNNANECISCPQGCTNCGFDKTSSNNSLRCTQCNSFGSFVLANGLCYDSNLINENCPENCKDCKYNRQQKTIDCLHCKEGYFIVKTSCVLTSKALKIVAAVGGAITGTGVMVAIVYISVTLKKRARMHNDQNISQVSLPTLTYDNLELTTHKSKKPLTIQEVPAQTEASFGVQDQKKENSDGSHNNSPTVDHDQDASEHSDIKPFNYDGRSKSMGYRNMLQITRNNPHFLSSQHRTSPQEVKKSSPKYDLLGRSKSIDIEFMRTFKIEKRHSNKR